MHDATYSSLNTWQLTPPEVNTGTDPRMGSFAHNGCPPVATFPSFVLKADTQHFSPSLKSSEAESGEHMRGHALLENTCAVEKRPESSAEKRLLTFL